MSNAYVKFLFQFCLKIMFYLQIPDINVPIVNIEDSALARLGFFATYAQISDNPKNVEYLRNSSLLDYIGFLCLRTYASLTNDCTIKEIIIEGECRLITERLSLLKPNYLRKYLIHTIDDIHSINSTDDNINVLLNVCLEYKNKQHEPCNEHCNKESIKVPWQKCHILVSSRNVELSNGIATVPCNQWSNMLVNLFRLIYIKSLHHISLTMSSTAESKSQFEYLSERINCYYNSKVSFWKNFDGQISLEELNLKRKLLPPCMLLSFNSLFVNHRLAHDPRYRLTLFLKSIGVPLNHTLMLFKQEYSKCGNPGSTCTHTWEEHYKKIEYNIRHTYGIVGSRKNYQMTSCLLMQKNNIQVSDEGCCPFVHCSDNKLKYILEEFTSISDEEMTIINNLKNSDQPIRACQWYAHKTFQMSESFFCHNTPAQYFFNSMKATSQICK